MGFKDKYLRNHLRQSNQSADYGKGYVIVIFSNWSRGIIVAAVAFLTILFAIYVDRLETSRTFATFDSYAAEGERGLINRTDTYVMTLDAASGLLMSSDVVTSGEWQSYVDLLDIETRLPGILGVGYITLVRAGAGFDITKPIVQHGLTVPPIHPNTGLDERFVIQFIEPMSDNKAALGLDIGFEPMRRAAAQKARETNTLRLSGAITLVQDNEKKPGFLLLRPVYASGADLSVPQQREAAFRGWTYMPFTANAVFGALTAQRNDVKNLTVVDVTDPDAKIEIYTDRPALSDHTPMYTATRNIELFGRSWEMTWTSTPMYEQANASLAKWIVLALGLALTWLLALMLHIISRREKQIETEVSIKTRQLRAKTGEAQSVIDNAVFSVIVLDEHGCIVSTNKAARDLFGNDCLMINQPISATLTIGEVPERLHGDAHPARVANRPDLRLLVEQNEWRTETGELRKSLLVQDVTEILAAEHKLQEAEARWNMALAGAQIGVFDIDLRTQKSVVSDTWRDLMGLSQDVSNDDAQKIFLDRIHPEDLPILDAADRNCILGLTDRSIAEYRMRFADGSYRWMKSNAVVVARDENGTALRLLGAQTDVTQLRNAQDALTESRERFELVLEQAPVGMALFNRGGYFHGVNDALCRMTGYSPEELRGGMRFRDLISKDDTEWLINAVQELRRNEQTSFQGEFLLIPKTGPSIWGLVSIAWTRVLISGEDVFIVQINDISEKKNIEKIKSEFVATVSHELRTPLTSIKGALGLLRGPMIKDMPAGADRLLEIASTNTERLTALVNDILDLEKISSGDINFHIGPFCMGQLLRDGVEQMLPFATQHNVQFTLDLPQNDVCTKVDPQRTQQLIANLLSNACKYSDDDTFVHIRLEEINGQALVCIVNSGPPIPDEFKTRIFRPFSQADGSDTRFKGGTGLGLKISREIVERMDGQIGFQSNAGSPIVFWFTVPLAPSGQAAIDQHDPVGEIHHERLNVLHIEDDSDFLEIVRTGLKDKADVTSVLSICDAKLAILQGRFDVVVIDWELSDGHARELLSGIAKHQPQAKIISLSARETSFRDARVDHEIVKSRTDLGEIVSKVVEVSQLAS